LLRAVLEESQLATDAAASIVESLDLLSGTGAALDVIGAWLRAPRFGEPDSLYRLRLRVEVAVLLSRGSNDDILAVLQAALAEFPGTVTEYEEPSPATVIYRAYGPLPSGYPAAILRYLQRSRVAGVRLELEYSDAFPGESFTLSDDGDEAASTTQGFGDSDDPSTGGKLAGYAL
jgi:hypothetical protein